MTPEQWATVTDTNIEKAEEECKASATLRGVIDSILNQCAQDIESQRAKVNLASEKRTQETADAKHTLEQHLEKVRVSYACGAIPSEKFGVYRASVKTISIHSSGEFISVFSHTYAGYVGRISTPFRHHKPSYIPQAFHACFEQPYMSCNSAFHSLLS